MIEEIDNLDLKPRMGKCSVCGRENIEVRPVMWNLPFIECKCHTVSGHTERKQFCRECEPICPQYMHVHFDTYILSAINELIYNHEDEYKEIKDRHYHLQFENEEGE